MYTVYIWFMYIYINIPWCLQVNQKPAYYAFLLPLHEENHHHRSEYGPTWRPGRFDTLLNEQHRFAEQFDRFCWWHRRHRLLQIFDAIGQLYWWTELCRDWEVWCLHLFPLAMWSDLNRVFCCAAAQAEVLHQLGVERRAPRGTLLLSVGCISKCVCCKYVACNYSSITCAIIYYT